MARRPSVAVGDRFIKLANGRMYIVRSIDEPRPDRPQHARMVTEDSPPETLLIGVSSLSDKHLWRRADA
ncbi:MAG TPA: hypothetical protein VD978_31655 [Azospirillum sp.]|nr:hypothetical protein [Azospirillum sp.]